MTERQNDDFDDEVKIWAKESLGEALTRLKSWPKISTIPLKYLVISILMITSAFTAYVVGYISHLPRSLLLLVDQYTAAVLIFSLFFILSSAIIFTAVFVYFIESFANYRSTKLLFILGIRQIPLIKRFARRVQKFPGRLFSYTIIFVTQATFLVILLDPIFAVAFILQLALISIFLLLPEIFHLAASTFGLKVMERVEIEDSDYRRVTRYLRLFKNVISKDKLDDGDFVFRLLPHLAAIVLIGMYFLSSAKGISVLRQSDRATIEFEDQTIEGVVFAMTSSGFIFARVEENVLGQNVFGFETNGSRTNYTFFPRELLPTIRTKPSFVEYD